MRGVAAHVGVHLATAWRWVLRGVRGRRLRSVLIGGRRYVLRADLAAFLGDAVNGQSAAHPAATVAGKVLDSEGVREGK